MGVLKVPVGGDWRKVGCNETMSPYPAEVLADSPAGYWRLGEDFTSLGTSTFGQALVDASGNSRGGVYDNGVSNAASLLAGGSDFAKNFHASLAGNTNVDYASWMNTSAVTVEAIISTTVSGIGNILDRDKDDGSANRVFQWRLSSGKLQFILIGSSVVTATGATSVNDGGTHHVAATYDGSAIKLYVDGVLDASVSTSVSLPSNVAPIKIGYHPTQPFDGVIDEVAYYTSALSGARIAAHAAAVSVADPVAGRLRLRLPDGSWVREVCDDDGPSTTAATGWTFTTGPTTANSQTVAWRYDGTTPPTSPVIYDRIDDLGGSVSGGRNPTSSGPSFAAYSLPFTLGSGRTLATFRVYDPTGTVLELEWTVGPERHPLKIEDPANPGTWITVGCFTPV